MVLTDTQANTDAFDRFRVSEPTTLFELNHIDNKRPRLVDEIVTGSGVSTHNMGSYCKMEVGSSGPGRVIRQTFEYIPYQPGKSRLMLFTGVLEAVAGGVANVTSRVGSYDDGGNKTFVLGPGDGEYFELTNSGLYACERLTNSNTSVIQSSWNYDVFDGTESTSNPSGFLVNDYSKAMILAIDQEWLGIGPVRFGFFINGSFRLGHTFNHSGIGTPTSTAITYPYTKTGKLPIRYEIISSAAATAEMRMICSTIISEGGYDPIGDPHSNVTVNATVPSSLLAYTPVMSLKLIESRNNIRHTLMVKNVSVLNKTGSGSSASWRLFLLGDDSKLTGASFSNIHVDSSAQVDESATFVDTDGAYQIASGFVETRSSQNLTFSSYISSPIVNASIIGKSKILCLAATKTNGTPSIYGLMDWLEIH